jgi:hypothetical protein|tara:strand:+ start:10 stop:1407 length:1398 start_codon:yes stop_codon:yes gene_type:complete
MIQYSLDEIDVTTFKTIKAREKWYDNQDHSRWVFYDETNKLYYKIWNETYIRRNTIVEAFESGFYDLDMLPALKGIIFWEGICRGYVMEECEKHGILEDDFFDDIKKRTTNTDMFAYDLCPNHIFKFNEKTTIIDLEGVYQLNQYQTKKSEHHSLGIPGRFVEYEIYDEYINSLIYKPLSEKQFLSMPLQKGRGGKEIILNDYTLTTVKDVIDFYSDENNVKHIESKLTPNNWQYYNCMMAEFRHNVGDHHEIGWENMTKEYYESLSMMSDDEIETFLKNNPAPFDVCFIKHGFHRAVSMIGRMINGKPYIPFYVRRDVVNPIENINYLDKIKDWPKKEYTIVQSGILALMGIRKNSDLDVVISSKLKNKIKEIPSGVEIMSNRGKFRVFGCKDDDDFVYNFSVNINGYNFSEPRFYFSRLWPDRKSKIEDQKNILNFKERGIHSVKPFSNISIEKWGFELLPKK